MDKKRDHRTGLINLYLGSYGYLTKTRVHGHLKKTAILRGHEIRYIELTLCKSVYFTGYVSIRRRNTRSGHESFHKCTTSFNSGTRGRCLTSEYKPSESLNSNANQYLYEDTSGNLWLHHYPYYGLGGVWIRHKISSTVLRIYRHNRMLSVKIQNTCDPQWYIFFR